MLLLSHQPHNHPLLELKYLGRPKHLAESESAVQVCPAPLHHLLHQVDLICNQEIAPLAKKDANHPLSKQLIFWVDI